MATDGVRVSATRRKPSQSRARASSEALQEAFVRVLLERGYAGVTIREVAAVAGVGVGTFYEYVANKQALAALTIHMRVKALALSLQQAIEALDAAPVHTVIDRLLDQQVDAVMADAPTWAALFMLERQVSTPQAFRKHYAQFVDLWLQALSKANDFPASNSLPEVARMVHAIVYGSVTQALLTQGPQLDQQALRRELGLAVHGYLGAPRP